MPWFQNDTEMWYANDDNTILMSGPYPAGSVNVSANFRNDNQPPGGGDANDKPGGFTPEKTPSNQPGGYTQSALAFSTNARTWDDSKGDAQLRSEVTAAGYGGPWDHDSMVRAWNNANSGGSSGSAGSSGSGSSGSGGARAGIQTVGGLGQLEYDIALKNWELLNQRLKELDIPGLNLQRRSQLFAEINALRGQTGYINPEREARMIPGYTSPVEEGGYGYTPYPWTVYEGQPAKAQPPPPAQNPQPTAGYVPPDPNPDPGPGKGWLPDMPPEANTPQPGGDWPRGPGQTPYPTPNEGWPRNPGQTRPDDLWAQMQAAWQRRR